MLKLRLLRSPWTRPFILSRPQLIPQAAYSSRRRARLNSYDDRTLPSDPKEHETFKLEAARHRLGNLVRNDFVQGGYGYFKDKCKEPEFQGANRPAWLMWALDLFVSHGNWEIIRRAYTRITTEGFILPPDLRAQYNAMAAAHGESRRRIVSAVTPFLHDPYYTEHHLRHLLLHLDHSGYSPSIVTRIAEAFARGQPKGAVHPFEGATISILVGCCLRGDAPSLAKRWLNVTQRGTTDRVLLAQDLKPEGRVKTSDDRTRPFATALQFIVTSPDVTTEDVEQLLQYMGRLDIQPNGLIINLLIAYAVRSRDYTQAFDFYAYLRELSIHDPTFRPSSYTFNSLFKALSHLQVVSAKARTPRARAHALPKNIVLPRSLFTQMMADHAKRTGSRMRAKSSVINPALMNHVLRLFLADNDLSAALVALRAFVQCGILPDLTSVRFTLAAVVVALRARLHALTPSASDWLYTFFGAPLATADRLALIADDKKLIQLLLNIAALNPRAHVDAAEIAAASATIRRTYNLRHGSAAAKRGPAGALQRWKLHARWDKKHWTGQRVCVPTLPELLGQKTPHFKATWDAEPLFSLLSRTAMAGNPNAEWTKMQREIRAEHLQRRNGRKKRVVETERKKDLDRQLHALHAEDEKLNDMEQRLLDRENKKRFPARHLMQLLNKDEDELEKERVERAAQKARQWRKKREKQRTKKPAPSAAMSPKGQSSLSTSKVGF